MMTLRFLFVFAFGLCASCTKPWSSSLERVQQECGEDMPAAPRYFKVLDPSGQPLESAALYDVKASLRQGSQLNALTISSRGCLGIPADAEQIELQVLKKNWAAVEAVNQGPAFQTLRLRETEPLKITLTCPTEGYWAANQSLKLPLHFEGPSDPSLFELDLRAVDDKGKEVSLYAKRLGEKTWNAETALDLSGLEEKLYTLVAYQRDLSRQTNLVATRGCPLAILRRRPVVDGLRQQGPEVVKQGAILPWTMPLQDNARLHVCREPYASAEDLQNSCQPVSTCKDPGNFRVENLVRAEKAGLWKYFVYADDAALNKSELSCQTLIISSSQPTVQIQWRDPELNTTAEPLLKTPKPLLSLDISTFHPTIPSALLDRNLTCKAELSGSGWTHAAKEIRCLSGACKNLSLATFQPCSNALDLSLVAALNDASLLDSRLRITVRVQDGADGEAEATRDIWLRKSLWGNTPMPPPELAANDLPWFTQILPLPNQELVGAHNNRTFLYQNETWRPLPIPFEGKIIEIRLVTDSDGRIVGRFRIKDPTLWHDLFAVLNKDHWEPFTIQEWPEGQKCDELTTVDDGTMLCATGGTQVLFNRQQKLDIIKQREVLEGNGCFNIGSNSIGLQNRAKTWYLPCPLGLMTRVGEDTLENIVFPSGFPTPAEESYEFDGQGRLWMIFPPREGEPIQMGYVDGKTFTPITAPITLEPTYPSLTLARNERGDIQFQHYVWNDAQRKWLELDAIRAVFPSGPVSVRRLPAGGLIYENATQTLVEQDGRTAFVPKRGMNVFRHEAIDQAILHPDGTLWITFPGRGTETNALRMRTNSSLHWGFSTFNIPREGIMFQGRTDTGETIVRLVSGAFYIFKDAQWSLFAPTPDISCTRPFVAGQDLWCGGRFSLIQWNPATERWDEVWHDTEEGEYSSPWFAEQGHTFFLDAAGRRWFLKSGAVVVNESDTWDAWKPIERHLPEDAYEPLQAAELVDGRLVWVTSRAIFRENGRDSLPQTWAELDYENDPFVVKGLGHGFVAQLYDEDEVLIVDLHKPKVGRSSNYKEKLKDDDGFRSLHSDAQGRLILVTRSHVYMEKQANEWSEVASLHDLQRRLGTAFDDWDNAVIDADGRSLWLNAANDQGSEVIQVLLPVK